MLPPVVVQLLAYSPLQTRMAGLYHRCQWARGWRVVKAECRES